jgi:glyoxylase-like metal-dependent hydrolase (beta-lactamase superfamily II)
MSFHRKECRIGNVYLIETMQFNMETITSVFCYSDGSKSLLMDIGTSDNIDAVFQSLTRQGIAPESLEGIVLSHYHFDHGGGSAELWKRMKSVNKNFKIYTNSITKSNLQNSAGHLHGAGTTFGKFVGTMEFIPDEAFYIVELNDFLPVEFSGGERIQLVHTPGHTTDHCSPSVVAGDRTVFTFAGEALGTIYTNNKMLSTPTSMPPNFNYNDYISSIGKLRSMNPELIGFCHFGILSGADDINFVFEDHLEFMKRFRQEIIDAYSENPSTSNVLSRTEYLWKDRIDNEFAGIKGSEAFFGNLRLALTYGVMVDLGFRKPKYESKTPQ